MDQPTLKPAPGDEPTFTLYRFCLRRGLALTNRERTAIGVELAQLARERQIPRKRGRERIDRVWLKNRLYPESFLEEWLARYRQANPSAPARSPKPKPAAHG